MKKNLLFVMPGLSAGGGEKSLVNLLSQIDFGQYAVDLFLFNHEGIFMEFLPKEVNVLPLPESFRLFHLPLARSVKELVLRHKLPLAYSRTMFAFKNAVSQSQAVTEQYSWKYISRSVEPLEKRYDVAIGFLEKTSTYFCVDKVNAVKKIGWVHIDYDKLGMDPEFDKGYFQRLDHIVTVSEECVDILARRFPEQRHKIELIYNIISPRIIRQMADQAKVDVYGRSGNEIVILSIGRLHPQKGFELAIEACKLLVNKGYDIRWNVIGSGEEKARLTRLIREHGLENHFKLLGLMTNPYSYIKHADFYVQTSRFEGKSIAIDEAKILNKPILVTNFSTAKDQIRHEHNGLIASMNPEDIARGIERLIEDRELRARLSRNLSLEKLGTEEEIDKLYRLVGEAQ
ncbi:glycosyltransferase [Paenibacillus sp. 7124]|uniref:Glycosyltransferase n=1 Tax=Paenibacillus apii TaxID=1850370 RepID=A0A6M1PUA6_9BACL|nr:glycosyltransferase [Paenibacillus apii]NGM85592.1 glycosyltransferase [Paenibacillus apii]